MSTDMQQSVQTASRMVTNRKMPINLACPGSQTCHICGDLNHLITCQITWQWSRHREFVTTNT